MDDFTEDYQDNKVLIAALTAQIMFALHTKPSLNLGCALGYIHSVSSREAVQLWVQEYWVHYPLPRPTDLTSLFLLSGTMANDINTTVTTFYSGQTWQHVPEYPED